MRHLFGLLLGFCVVVGAFANRKLPYILSDSLKPIPFATRYVSVSIDQFTPQATGNFPLKYLLNDTFFQDGSPLFFYTGNEGTIEGFAQNAGILLDLAPQFSAIVVFAEHRYYGDSSSMPYGQDSFANVSNAAYLSIEQTLRDYAQVIQRVKQSYNFGKVIAFGGSYGGMLSAWFRLKYPHVVDGAWAASAPVAYFRGTGVQLGDYDKVVTDALVRFGCNKQAVIDAFTALDQWRITINKLSQINRIFNTDQTNSKIESRDDINKLKAFIRDAFETMSMVNYPYANNFLRQVDAWPLRQACSGLQNTGMTQVQAATALKTALDAFYGQNSVTCFKDACGDPSTVNLGDLRGWNWQSCTEIAIDICSQGAPNDVFWLECSDQRAEGVPNFVTFYKQQCADINSDIAGYRSNMVDFDAITTFFSADLNGGSKIILTNGVLDPWSAGAARVDANYAAENNIFSYTIDGAAHHLDLRLPNSCDPPTVQNARFQIVGILKCWLGQAGSTDDCSYNGLQWPLPSWDGPGDSSNCQDQVNQYPWNQNKGGQSVSPSSPRTPTSPGTGSPPTGSPPTGSPPTGSPPTGSPPTGSPPSLPTGSTSSVPAGTGSTSPPSPATTVKGGAGVLPVLSLIAAMVLSLMHVVRV